MGHNPLFVIQIYKADISCVHKILYSCLRLRIQYFQNEQKNIYNIYNI